MPNGIYIFGGNDYPTMWEWLPSGSSTWVQGGSIPWPGFNGGCGVRISLSELLLIGGKESEQRILKFNVETGEWTEMEEVLEPGRYFHACVVFKNNIIVNGGQDSSGEYLKLAEIFDKDNLAISYSSDMKEARCAHGLVVAHHKNQPTVLAIGGYPYTTDTIEKWDPESKTWSLTNDLRLSKTKNSFGILSVPTHLVCP